MEAACAVCRPIIEDNGIQEANQLILHIPVSVICHPSPQGQYCKKDGKREWRKRRTDFQFEIKKYISALRNSGGGVLFVHIEHIDPKDWSLDEFNRLTDNGLNDMIEDGSLFVTVYKKDWICDTIETDTENETVAAGGQIKSEGHESELQNKTDRSSDKSGPIEALNNGIVVINAAPSATVVTADFKTKLPLDSGIVDPFSTNIVWFLTNNISFEEQSPKFLGIDSDNLRENRHVQVKAVFDEDKTITSSPEKFVDHLWENLRLREYLTSMSKIQDGGSVFFGVQEEDAQFGKYVTKKLEIKGFEFHLNQVEVIDRLKSKAKENTVVLLNNGVVADSDMLIDNFMDIKFHPLEKEHHFVMEIAIAYVKGLVFFDAEGPAAYQLGVRGIKRLSIGEWYQLQLKEKI